MEGLEPSVPTEIPAEELNQCHMITEVVPTWIQEVAHPWEEDAGLRDLIAQLQVKPDSLPGYTFRNGRLKFQDKLIVGPDMQLRKKFLNEFHNSPIGGHSGIRGTYERMSKFFRWSTMRQDVITFVRECDTCQQQKHETLASPGLLQPLPVPHKPWTDLSMDFIGLPTSTCMTVIWVIVDRFTKYAHFIALKHPFSAAQLAHTYV